MPQSPKKPFEVVMREDGVLEIISDRFPGPSPSERAERNKISAKCGHVKRRLVRNEPLTGELLEIALSAVGENNNGLVNKLKAGEQLSDYQLHLMLDMYLLHKRLAG